MNSELLKVIPALLLCTCSVPGSQAVSTAQPQDEVKRSNVLLICIDDLRPELGCYGADHVLSPNLDAFAGTGMRFDRHYVQFPTCGASRYSFLTGQRPSMPAHYGNGAFSTLPDGRDGTEIKATLPGTFRAAGYRSVCLGKISHSHDGRTRSGAAEVPGAWDALPTDPGAWKQARHLLHGYANGVARVAGKSSITEAADVEDDAYPDGILAKQAVQQLRELAGAKQPFFLAVGFFKPHLPFAAPKRYWDLYDRDALPLSPRPDIPEDLPGVNGWSQSGEVTNNYAGAGFDDGQWSTAERRRLRHGYFACVSYVDAQVGRVLDELEDLGLGDDTIVVVWGDHGWHLGDLGLFGKHTTYEAALRSTLLVRVPGMTPRGSSSGALIESLDVYPTLAQLCGLPFPDDLPGQSFTGVLRNPATKHRGAALSYWRRGPWIATSLRTDRYRLVGWTDPVTGREGGFELYDFGSPGSDSGPSYEKANVAVKLDAVAQRLIRKHLKP